MIKFVFFRKGCVILKINHKVETPTSTEHFLERLKYWGAVIRDPKGHRSVFKDLTHHEQRESVPGASSLVKNVS